MDCTSWQDQRRLLSFTAASGAHAVLVVTLDLRSPEQTSVQVLALTAETGSGPTLCYLERCCRWAHLRQQQRKLLNAICVLLSVPQASFILPRACLKSLKQQERAYVRSILNARHCHSLSLCI